MKASRESAARSVRGSLLCDDGTARPARYYFGGDEPEPLGRELIDSSRHATWIEDDGAIGIRRGASVSVGSSRQYVANYDDVDWGN